ncbi:MAG: hypothetical protein V4710_21885, partial [Verrucomicrobiota bacterium]
YPVRGSFDALGTYFGQIGLNTKDDHIYLFFQFNAETASINLQVNQSRGGEFLESQGVANRVSWSPQKPCAAAGYYTVAMASSPDKGAQGDGFATATISSLGVTRLVGTLADGTPWSSTASLDDESALSLYASLYKGNGSLSGILYFSLQRGQRGDGQLVWCLPKTSEAISSKLEVNALPYEAPASGEPALFFTRALLELKDGGLVLPVEKFGTLNGENRFIFETPQPEAVQLAIDPATGIVSGTFVHPLHGLTKLRGIARQNLNRIDGFFVGQSGTGSMHLSERIILLR